MSIFSRGRKIEAEVPAGVPEGVKPLSLRKAIKAVGGAVGLIVAGAVVQEATDPHEAEIARLRREVAKLGGQLESLKAENRKLRGENIGLWNANKTLVAAAEVIIEKLVPDRLVETDPLLPLPSGVPRVIGFYGDVKCGGDLLRTAGNPHESVVYGVDKKALGDLLQRIADASFEDNERYLTQPPQHL